MKWIIKRLGDGMFAVSPRVFVFNKVFARRFNSRKQAEAYMISSGFDKRAYIACELEVET